MNRFRLSLITLLCSAVLALGFFNVAAAQDDDPAAEEGEVTMDSVPSNIMSLAESAVSAYGLEGEISFVSFDAEGTPSYEFANDDIDNEGWEIDVTEDAFVAEIEQGITEEDVPADVLDAVNQYFPDFTIEQIERSLRPQQNGLQEIYYEMTGSIGDTPVDIEVRSDVGQMVIEL